MALDATFSAADALACDAPEEALALVAVGRGRSRPRLEIVRSRARYWIDETLQRFLVHVHFLHGGGETNDIDMSSFLILRDSLAPRPTPNELDRNK